MKVNHKKEKEEEGEERKKGLDTTGERSENIDEVYTASVRTSLGWRRSTHTCTLLFNKAMQLNSCSSGSKTHIIRR